MKKICGLIAVAIVLMGGVAFADDTDEIIYNGVEMTQYFPDKLAEPLDWSAWEMMCYDNGTEPDFTEYCRFLADWGGIDFDEEIEWVD